MLTRPVCTMKDNNVRIIKSSQQDVQTWVFDQENGRAMEIDREGGRQSQIFLAICSSLVCLPFGIMLGWPSPTYVTILSNSTANPLPITMVQSPLIAGFLMFGATFTTPSSTTERITPKNGMLVSTITMTIGWFLMWQATNLFYLLGSRMVIGLGFGFGLGKIKAYIKSCCRENLTDIMTRMVSSYIMLGVLLAFIMGIFVDFRTFSLIAIFTSIAIFFITFFLPNKKPPKKAEDNLNIIGIFKMKELRHYINILMITALIQQFTGAPALIVYCQFTFQALNIPDPQYCAVLYGIVFLFCNLLGTYYTSKLNKKYVLLISCLTVLLILVCLIFTLYFRVHKKNYAYVSFILMILYVICHTLGLATVPFRLPEYLFPKNARMAASNLYFMCYLVFAVIITKMYQVFYSAFPLHILFSLFATVGTVGCVFICLFIPTKSPNVD